MPELPTCMPLLGDCTQLRIGKYYWLTVQGLVARQIGLTNTSIGPDRTRLAAAFRESIRSANLEIRISVVAVVVVVVVRLSSHV